MEFTSPRTTGCKKVGSFKKKEGAGEGEVVFVQIISHQDIEVLMTESLNS